MTAEESLTADEEAAKRDSAGRWPRWWVRLIADLLPARFAPSQDGLTAPRYSAPEWLSAPGSSSADVLELARRLHESAEDRAAGAEERGGKIAQTSLAMLAIAFTATGFIAARLRESAASLLVWFWLVPSAIAIFSLSMSALQGIGAQHRVRLSHQLTLAHVALAPDADRFRVLIEQEDRAALVANWSAGHRLNEVLQALAWLTRGILALIFAGGVAIVLWSSGAGIGRT